MELAQALLKLWERKRWVAVGLVVAAVAALGARQMLKSTVYSAATTQMIVDAPHSALGDINSSLEPFTTRAGVYALLMTSPEALNSIGRAAGIPGSEISAEGPPEATLPQVGQQPNPPSSPFKLQFNQDPTLPTIDIYAQAPTTQQATRLANGAVTGFTRYLTSLEVQGSVPYGQRVQIRQLGDAIGGVVNSGSGKTLAAIVAFVVFILWCCLILFVSKMRGLRTAEGFAIPGEGGRRRAGAGAEPWAGSPPTDDGLQELWLHAATGTVAAPAEAAQAAANGHLMRQADSPAPRDGD